MTFSQTLAQAIQAKKTPVLVGLDPRFDSLPEIMRSGVDPNNAVDVAAAFQQFCRAVIDVVAPLVPAVKPQSAFFEQYGPAGMVALATVVRYARSKGLVVIFDGKRNDIGSTAEAYAAGILGQNSPWGADALTVSPYLGDDSLTPFVKISQERDAGIFVLVKTSNPGGAMLQDLSIEDKTGAGNGVGETLYHRVAKYVQELSLSTKNADEKYGSVGAVVGATWPEQLAELRETMPHCWFLVPGFGSQGGSAQDVAAAFDADGLGAIINNSRGIIFSYKKEPFHSKFGEKNWQGAVESATLEMMDQLVH